MDCKREYEEYVANPCAVAAKFDNHDDKSVIGSQGSLLQRVGASGQRSSVFFVGLGVLLFVMIAILVRRSSRRIQEDEETYSPVAESSAGLIDVEQPME